MTQESPKRRNTSTRIVIANRKVEAARQKVVRAFFSWFTWRQRAFELTQTISPKRFAIPEFV